MQAVSSLQYAMPLNVRMIVWGEGNPFSFFLRGRAIMLGEQLCTVVSC